MMALREVQLTGKAPGGVLDDRLHKLDRRVFSVKSR